MIIPRRSQIDWDGLMGADGGGWERRKRLHPTKKAGLGISWTGFF